MSGRDRANLRTDIWGDDEWRSLSVGAQWLYNYLLTCSSLNYVGVADWRPTRIAGMASGLDRQQLTTYAAELETAHFIVTDDTTEEILVRSFLRHDGALTNPSLPKSIGKDFGGVASATLRSVIAHEVNRLRADYPDGLGKWNVWSSSRDLDVILRAKKLDIRAAPTTDAPKGAPGHAGHAGGHGAGDDTTTATTTTTKDSPPTRLPADWAPTAAHIERAKAAGVDLLDEVENFRLHAETYARKAVSWNGAFTTWLKKAKPSGKPKVDPRDEWKYNR